MTRFTLSMTKEQFNQLLDRPADDDAERAAILFCGTSKTVSETRLLVQEIQIIKPNHLLGRSPQHLSISSQIYVQALGKADLNGQVIVCVHSHPGGYGQYSRVDDENELDLFRTAYIRAPRGPHGSMIIVGTDRPTLIGRVWLQDGRTIPLDRIRVVGNVTRFFDSDLPPKKPAPLWALRQIEAFGPVFHELFSRLHIGVVGAGGTGSAICEQLIRMGIGTLTVCDDDFFEDPNVNRVYGSGLDGRTPLKVQLVEEQAKFINTGTRVIAIPRSITHRETAMALRDCDLVFGSTDDLLGRAILNQLAFFYYIPVIDMGVHLDSEHSVLKQVVGRVTIIMPPYACLHCRGAIPADQLKNEVLRLFNPADYSNQIALKYAPELAISNPSVVMFTTSIAARAMMEFLQLITGFMGEDRTISEIFEIYDQTRIGTNDRPAKLGCLCSSPAKWGAGDQDPYLSMGWPNQTSATFAPGNDVSSHPSL